MHLKEKGDVKDNFTAFTPGGILPKQEAENEKTFINPRFLRYICHFSGLGSVSPDDSVKRDQKCSHFVENILHFTQH